MSKYAELLERVKAATGPDQYIDAFLWQSLVSDKPAAYGVPRYTASVDAALALVEKMLRPAHPGMTFKLKAAFDGGDRDYWWCEITWPSSERQGRAYTAPLAILEALLVSLE